MEQQPQQQQMMELEHSIGCSGGLMESVHLHPDKQHLVYMSGGCIVIRNLKDNHDQQFMNGHDDKITCLAVNNSGTQLASGQKGDNSDIIIWDYQSKKMMFKLSEHDYEISILKYTNDDKLLFSCGTSQDKKIFIWNTENGYIVGSVLLLPDPLNCMSWGGYIKDIKLRDIQHKYQFCTAGNKQLYLWQFDITKGSFEYELLNIGATYRDYKCIEFSKGRQDYLYAGTSSGDFLIIQVKAKQLQNIVQVAPQGVLQIRSLTPDLLVVGAGNGDLVYFQTQKNTAQQQTKISVQGAITGISQSQDSQIMTVVTNHGFVYRVDNEQQKEQLINENHTDSVEFISFPNQCSDKFASASLDGSIRFWDVNEYQVFQRIYFKNVSPLSLNYNHDVMLSGWQDGKIRLFSTQDARMIWEIDNCHRNGVICIELANSRKFFVSGGHDGEVRVWETKTREMISHLKEHTNRVSKIMLFGNNQQHLLSASRDRALLCWDLKSEKRVSAHYSQMGGINSFDIIEGTQNVLTTGQDRKVTLWDLRQQQPVKQIDTLNNDECFAIKVSHNQKTFVTGGSQQVVKLWDINTMKCISEGNAHSGCIKTINYAYDDRQIVSAGQDGNIMLWNLYCD